MQKISRRNFIKKSVYTGSSMVASQIMGLGKTFAASEKFNINVGYLPITDHLILPISHALDNKNFHYINVHPYLCKSWDEILAKLDMGVFDAAFMLAPLAMHKVKSAAPMKCLLFGHTNGSVIAAKKTITDFRGLDGKSVGIPHSKSTHRVLLYKYFKDKGVLDKIKIRLVKVPPPLIIKNLKLGVLDAYAVAEPWGVRGVTEGVTNILEFSKNIIPDHACCIVMVKNRVVEKHPAALSEWVKSLNNAGRIIHDDPEQAGLIQKPYMHLSPADVIKVINDDVISYRNLYPDEKKLEVISELAFECGILAEQCDCKQFINNSFV